MSGLEVEAEPRRSRIPNFLAKLNMFIAPGRLLTTLLTLCLTSIVLRADDLAPLLTQVAEAGESAGRAGRKLLVIYYGNDIEAPQTSDPIEQNIKAFLQKIESVIANDTWTPDQQSRLRDIAEAIDKRHGEIIDQCTREIALLQVAAKNKSFMLSTIRNYGNSKQVTNLEPRRQLFRKIEWEHGPYAGGNDSTMSSVFQRDTIRIPFNLNDERFQYAVLNHPAVFREVIFEITNRFPADEYCYLLIIRSTASNDSMLTSILTHDVQQIDALALAQASLRAVDGVDLSSETAESISGRVNQVIVDKYLSPNTNPMPSDSPEERQNHRVDKSGRSTGRLHEFGTDKGEFLRILNEFGNYQKRYFPLVVVAGLRSRLETSSDAELKEILAQSDGNHETFHITHVQWLFLQGAPAIDLSAVIQQATQDPSPDFVDAMRRHLSRLP